MKKTARKTLVLMVAVLAVTILIAGCQDEQNQANTVSNGQTSRLAEAERMSKLVAAQNVDLKKQLKEQERLHERELERKRALHEKEMEKQKTLLEKCRQANNALEELSREGVESYMSTIVGPLSDENEKLRKENEALKVQIQDLQAQVDRLKAE
jgi:outer membrane murein-binding lipoprotein Lpp